MITDLNTKKITYAFGMPTPGRSYQSSNCYRYGMNGQEKDLEIFEGAMTAEYWEYDSRTGRRWNRDPVVKPWESSYACFSNNPIWFADPNGLDAVNGHKKEVASAKDKVSKAQGTVDNLKGLEGSIDKNDKSAVEKYNSDLNTANNELKSANNQLAAATEKYNIVEEQLTKFAFFDPTGYDYIDNLKDPDGQNVDIVFSIDNSMNGNTGGFDEYGRTTFASGEHGKTDIGFAVERTDGVVTNQIIFSGKLGDNTVYVPLLRKTSDGTIAHEKYHIYFFMMNVPNKQSDDLDEGGARKYEKNYNKSKIGKGSVPANFQRK